MFLPALKRFALVVFIIASALLAAAQQTHFIYLQTEDGQPFYVKLNNKVVSSSAVGYLILPKLPDSSYKITIGFPKKEFPEENFQILVDKKNQGFLLKNFREKGWGLFNMQSYAVVMGGNMAVTATSSKNLQDDQFSKLLANVVKDSSILEKREPVKEEVRKEPVKEETTDIAKTDSAALKLDSLIAKAKFTNAKVDSTIAALEKGTPAATVKAASVPAAQVTLSQLSAPTRFLNKKDKSGREMIYIDHGQSPDDTVRIFIPSSKSITKPGNVDTTAAQSIKKQDKISADSASGTVEQPLPQTKTATNNSGSMQEKDAVENKDTVISKKTDEVKPPEEKPKDLTNKTESKKQNDIVVLPKVVQSSSTNSDCKVFASNEDFLKLRKKMASETSDENMVKTAKKAFRTKCFSTEQIKDLSFLFLSNAGKYMFFDMAYPFASDSDQYNILEAQLTDSYYINRFKAMIHK